MRKAVTILLIVFFSTSMTSNIVAQTCCSGGVPLSGNLGLPSSDKNSWQFTLNYDFNVLNTLKFEDKILEDGTRKRTTHSALLEVGYTFSDKFSLDGFFSIVRQERKITPQTQPSTLVSTSGIGDAVLLAKYKILPFLHLGLGVKAPLGPSDLRSEEGFALVADLQPGSGAWDGILWSGFSKQITARRTLVLANTTIYRFTGKNNSYLINQTYEVGNEFQTITNLSDRFLLGKIVLDPSVALRYRRVASDLNNENTMPSTGGQWVFINPGISYRASEDFSIQANAEFPFYSQVTGTQLTPSYRINTGVYFRIKSKKQHTISAPTNSPIQ